MAMGEPRTEPSMEDILASIKRIIADDSQAAEDAVSHVEQTVSTSESSRSVGGALHLVDDRDDDESENAEEVLELTQPMEPAESAVAARPETRPESNVAESMRRSEPFSRSNAAAAPTILSDDAALASRQSLAALSALLVKPENEAGENTLEALVREMLRPMMKQWLDEKLPELVERLVEKEIARLTGRLG